jgi:hypothetical protein
MSTIADSDKRTAIVPRIPGLLLLAAVLLAVFIARRQTSHTVVLGSVWGKNGLHAIEEFDHRSFAQLLGCYVDQQGRVDYRRWQDNPDDLLELKNYLQSASRICWNTDGTARSGLSNTRAHEMAFWINAYNALTIHAILTVYPTESVRQHTSPLGQDLWSHHKLIVGTHAWSLQQIEEGPLAGFGDPRVHFAIVKGSLGCPRLLDHAFLPETIDCQLESCTREFLLRPSSLKVEGELRIHLSPVIRAAFADPEHDPATLCQNLARHVPDPQVARWLISGPRKLSWLRHDWSLNRQ